MSDQVVIYARFSTDEQEAGDTLERQRRVCDSFAALHGWVIVERLEDRGRSAFRNEHLSGGALGEFLARVGKGEVEQGTILLTERVDRLSRRPIGEAMAWIHNLANLGVKVAFADSGVIFDAAPDLATFLTTAIKVAVAHEESAKKSERVLSAKAGLWKLAEAREGAWTNLAARHPLWLQRTPAADGWVILEDRAQVVRDIYQWSADGLGAQAIARRLNEAKAQPFGAWRRHGKAWVLTPIQALISNRAVEGDFVAETGQFKGEAIRDFYPRIVDADLVVRARAAKALRAKVIGEAATNGVSNLWVGLVHCGECLERLAMTTNRRKGKAYRYFRCEGARQGKGCQNSGYYPIDRFEEAALDICLDLALDDRFFEASGELKELRIKKAEVEKGIADRKERRARLLDVFEKGDNQVRDRMRGLKSEIDALVHGLEAVEAGIERASGKVGAAEHLRRVEGLREATRSDDADVREMARARVRQVLRAVVSGVTARVVDGVKLFSLTILGAELSVRIGVDGGVQKNLGFQGDPLVWRQNLLSKASVSANATTCIVKVAQAPRRRPHQPAN